MKLKTKKTKNGMRNNEEGDLYSLERIRAFQKNCGVSKNKIKYANGENDMKQSVDVEVNVITSKRKKKKGKKLSKELSKNDFQNELNSNIEQELNKKNKLKKKKLPKKLSENDVQNELNSITEQEFNKKTKLKKKLPKELSENNLQHELNSNIEQELNKNIKLKKKNLPNELSESDLQNELNNNIEQKLKIKRKRKIKNSESFDSNSDENICEVPLKKKKQKEKTTSKDDEQVIKDNTKQLKKQKIQNSTKEKKKTVSFENDESEEDNKKKRRGKSIALKETRSQKDARTVFVGNVPHGVNKKHLAKLFSKFGEVQNVRLRGAVQVGKSPKKVTIMKKLFQDCHPPLIAYVLFSNKEGAANALEMNGKIYEGNHLRVNPAILKKADVYNKNKDNSVFLGNLPFQVKDEDIWNTFDDCGKIESIRIVRDSTSGIGKGFGYINFESASNVELALKMNGQKVNGRELRVIRALCKPKLNKNKKTIVTKSPSKENKQKQKGSRMDSVVPDKPERKKQKSFRGQAADLLKSKKKPKKNKLEVQKKMLAEKLVAKPKKIKKSDVI